MQVGETLENGYTVKTTFWNDFSIADKTIKFQARLLDGTKRSLIIGETVKPNKENTNRKMQAIKGTYASAFNEWKNNTEYLTELVLVLNWKGWQWYEKGIEDVAQLYFDLWEKADVYACNNLKGKDLNYFLSTTD